MSEGEAVICSTCGRVIGQYKPVNGRVWLDVGGMVVRDAYGSCCCGAPFTFHASDRQLQELIKRVKRPAPTIRY